MRSCRSNKIGFVRGTPLILAGTTLACLAPLAAAEPPVLSLRATEPLAAFTPDHPPDIEMTVATASGWRGFIRVERFDLLSEASTVDYLPVDVEEGKSITEKVAPVVAYGVYRLECAPVTDRGPLPAGTGTRVDFAYGPARDPHQLPDDWPLGAHITFEDPPLPGFKWYRYFSSWAEDNPAKGTFEWARLDTVFARVRKIGGRLLIANDSTPPWTAPERPLSRPWGAPSIAYPPDDPNDFRTFLNALLLRYDDKAGTLGGLEVWNEPNTPERWRGTPEQQVELARIFRESVMASARRVHRPEPARVIGISVSSGDATDYVQGVVKAGMLPYLDIVSGHWYEEMLTYDAATPINSLPAHFDLLAKPMHAAGFSLPIWNTESGIGCVAREDGRLVPQDELNHRATAHPGFDSKQPWLIDGNNWRDVSERRSAASYVAGITMLMDLGVGKTFVYSMRDQHWMVDGAPSLAWVSLAVFGDQIHAIDFRTVGPIKASMAGGSSNIRPLAYRFGSPKLPGVIVAWTYLQDLTVGRPKLWQPWLEPQPVRLAVSAFGVEVIDLYGREKRRMPVSNGSIVLPIGEEPVYLRELPALNSE